MNLKIAKTMLIICFVFIVAFYILKLIFPAQLLFIITDQNVLTFGNLIQERIWATHLLGVATTFVAYYLFVCAARGSFKLNWKQAIILIVATVIDFAVSEFYPPLMTHTSTSLMLLCAWLCKGKLSYTAVSFVLHGYLSQFLFSIRGFETVMTKINIASGLILMIEGWVWLVLLSLIFYLKEKKNGSFFTTISKQDD